AFQGTSNGHEEHWRVKFERGRSARQGAAWAIWEDGRIAGIVAEKSGEFTTLPLKCTGAPIELNAQTGPSGSIAIDVLLDGESDQSTARTAPMTGDLRWQTLKWEQGDLSKLTDKTIRLRFRLYNAKVFGVRGASLELVSPYSRK